MSILNWTIIELRGFGMTGAYFGQVKDNKVAVKTEFNGKTYAFIYEGNGKKKKIRETEVYEFNLIRMEPWTQISS